MTKHGFLLTAAVLLTLVACAPPPEPPPEIDIEAERAALTDAANRYNEGGDSMDIDAMASLYASDALVMAPDMETKGGAAGVREVLTGFKEPPGFEIGFGAPTVVVSKGADMGYTLADIELSFDGPDGKVNAKARDFHLWKKQADGSWKIVVDIWNSPEPASE